MAATKYELVDHFREVYSAATHGLAQNPQVDPNTITDRAKQIAMAAMDDLKEAEEKAEVMVPAYSYRGFHDDHH